MDEVNDNTVGGNANRYDGAKLVGWLAALVAFVALMVTLTSEDRWSESSVKVSTVCLVDGLRAADETGKGVEVAGVIADVVAGAVKARKGDPAELAAAVREAAERAGVAEGGPLAQTVVAAVCTEINRAHGVGVTEEQYLYRLSVIAECLKEAVASCAD